MFHVEREIHGASALQTGVLASTIIMAHIADYSPSIQEFVRWRSIGRGRMTTAICMLLLARNRAVQVGADIILDVMASPIVTDPRCLGSVEMEAFGATQTRST